MKLNTRLKLVVAFLTVHSFTMDFVLVLLLAFLSTGQSHSEVTEQRRDSCYKLCPPGFHKVGNCDDQVANLRCEKCNNLTFTEVENDREKCVRCGKCSQHKREMKICTFNSNVVCDCSDGYYYKELLSPDSDDCVKCSCKNCEVLNNISDYRRKCTSCQNCSEVSAQINFPRSPFPPSTNSSTAGTTTESTTTRTTASNDTSHPVMNRVPHNLNEMSWLFLVVVLVTLLLFLWLLLLYTRSPFRYPDSCLSWSVSKHLESSLEDPDFNEQSSHQGSSPNTLTLNICENTPMMILSQSPAVPEHLVHVSPQDAELKATSQHVQSDRWPAIVLYAIIKEVPLRRWKEFLRLLSVTDQQLERVELEAGLGLGSMERQYQMLRVWSQCSSASMNDIFSALHYMDLSGCAQLLQESLEKLQLAGLS